MLTIQKNVSLKPYNTFGIEVYAEHFVEVNTIEEIKWLAQQEEFSLNKLWLGGGSNMLLTQDIEGLVIKLNIKGIEVLSQEEGKTMVSAMGGENWHGFVIWAIENDLGGIENMSLIPGNVGTAPIQNIGAYGVELKDTFVKLEAYELATGVIHTFTKEDCQFGYRDSYFKRAGKGKYIILKVYFELTHADHQLNISYGAIEKELEKMEVEPSIQNISKAVINIRQSKLPNPEEVGNSGSFFKNPVIPEAQYQELAQRFPELVAYPAGAGQTKLAAGWLIEQAGWKGYRKGDAGVHAKQALVLVNYGIATGLEIAELSKEIQASVFSKFTVQLEAEVNII